MSTAHKFRVLDLNAPRFIKKRFDILSHKQFFSGMKEVHPELATYEDRIISKFIIALNKKIATEIVDNRNGIRLPESLGIAVAGACKISVSTAKRNIDYRASNQTGRIILHTNQTSDGYISKVKYSNASEYQPFKNNHMWCFDATRSVTRSLAKVFKQEGGYKKYIVFTTRQHIGHLIRPVKPAKVSKLLTNIKKKHLDQHNEFDI